MRNQRYGIMKSGIVLCYFSPKTFNMVSAATAGQFFVNLNVRHKFRFSENYLHETKSRRNYVPSVDVAGSGDILEANAKRATKYIAQMTLSAATPAAKTDGETPRASEIAT